MRRSGLFLILVGSLFSVACGPGQIEVTAEIDVPDPEAEGARVNRAIAETEIQVLPFDRDAVFAELEGAFPTPEPEVPADLLATRDEIAAAQAEWNASEATWGAGRERLQQIYDEMQPLNQAEARYITLFREYQDVEAQVSRAERVKDQAFRRFTDLQAGYIQRKDSMNLVREQWADEAFASAFEVFALKATEAGQNVIYDTTDAQGYVSIDVPPGTWWVHAFYEEAYQELYWNLPITVERGDPLQVRLTRETAEARPIL